MFFYYCGNMITYFVDQDVLNTISASHGKVNRIVIFRKQGVQAMVEYPFYSMKNNWPNI